MDNDDPWDSHSDEESGSRYYHNKVTGITTWDDPRQLPSDTLNNKKTKKILLSLPKTWVMLYDESVIIIAIQILVVRVLRAGTDPQQPLLLTRR